MAHFATAHTVLLEEENVNFTHLITNIHRDPRFESILMRITSYDKGVRFRPGNEVIGELATYGVIAKGTDGLCEITNPIYLYRILQELQPLIKLPFPKPHPLGWGCRKPHD